MLLLTQVQMFDDWVQAILSIIILFGLEGRKEMFYLMTHSTHFIYGYMASDIW